MSDKEMIGSSFPLARTVFDPTDPHSFLWQKSLPQGNLTRWRMGVDVGGLRNVLGSTL